MKEKNKYINFNNGEKILMTDELFAVHQNTLKDDFKNLYFEFSKSFAMISVVSDIKINLNLNWEKINYIDFNVDDLEHRVYFRKIKNSGQKNIHRKRIHIEPKMYSNNRVVSVVGLLSLGNKTLFCVTDYLNEYIHSKFLKNDFVVKNNSSFWINEEDMNFIIEERDKKSLINNHGYMLTKSPELVVNSFKQKKQMVVPKKIRSDLLEKINNDTSFLGSIIKNEIDIDDLFDFVVDEPAIPDFDWKNSVDTLNNNRLIRDKKMIQDLISIHNECLHCKIKKTFDRRGDGGIQYFEFHHFIPYNFKVQKKYKKTLDSKLNIVTFCVSCHKKIHLSSEQTQSQMLSYIYDLKVDDEFKKNYPNIEKKELIKIYWELFSSKEV